MCPPPTCATIPPAVQACDGESPSRLVLGSSEADPPTEFAATVQQLQVLPRPRSAAPRPSSRTSCVVLTASGGARQPELAAWPQGRYFQVEVC